MKTKTIVIALAGVIASVGITFASHSLSLRNVVEETRCEAGMKCNMCKGTGWQPNSNLKCIHCRGTGANSSY